MNGREVSFVASPREALYALKKEGVVALLMVWVLALEMLDRVNAGPYGRVSVSLVAWLEQSRRAAWIRFGRKLDMEYVVVLYHYSTGTEYLLCCDTQERMVAVLDDRQSHYATAVIPLHEGRGME